MSGDPKIRQSSIAKIKSFISDESKIHRQSVFLCMILCHTAIVQAGLTSKYISESEDEIAMLTFAKQIGFRFAKRAGNMMHLKIHGSMIRYKIKGLLPFDPVRKMMSVIVETEDGAHCVLSKGADSSVLKRCVGLTVQERETI